MTGKRFREGVLGVLVDEFERATEGLKGVLEGLTDAEFEAICNPAAEEEEFRSVQGVVHHVVRGGYGHANHMRVALSVHRPPVQVPVAGRRESRGQLTEMVAYMVATFDGRWGMTHEQIGAVEIEAPWDTTYDLEQMLEHAIVHVLRHRRQIERFLSETAPGSAGPAA